MDPKKTLIVATALALFYGISASADVPGQILRQAPPPQAAYAGVQQGEEGPGPVYDPSEVESVPVAGPQGPQGYPVGPIPPPAYAPPVEYAPPVAVAPQGPPCEYFQSGGPYFGQPFPPYCGAAAGLVAAVPLDPGGYVGPIGPAYPNGYYVNPAPVIVGGANYYRPMYGNRGGAVFNNGFRGGVRGGGFVGGGVRMTPGIGRPMGGGMRGGMGRPMGGGMGRPMGGGMRGGGFRRMSATDECSVQAAQDGSWSILSPIGAKVDSVSNQSNETEAAARKKAAFLKATTNKCDLPGSNTNQSYDI